MLHATVKVTDCGSADISHTPEQLPKQSL